MPYITPNNRKFCLNCDIADALLMRQDEFPCERYDEPYYNMVDKKFQTKLEILKNFWLGCEQTPGCGDGLRENSAPYEAWMGVDKFYLENLFKYPVSPNDLPYNEPQFSYTDSQWVQYKDIFGAKYHFTINGMLSDSWVTSYYKQTNKSSLPASAKNDKNFTVTSFNNRYKSTYTDDYDTAKNNAPEGCEHYDRYDDEMKIIYHHGIKPLRLMYKVGSSWTQDSFTSSESPFVATATPRNYIIPSSENSTIYDTDITFSLPEYSGLTEVNYVWNIRQIESGLTLKAYITQKKKTGTVKFVDGNDIILEGIGSYGSKGVTPSKGIIYSGDYNDGVNDTISWYNKTNNISPSTGNFTDETHADSKGLNDNVTITSSESWCHDIAYNINNFTAYVDWWKDGEGKGQRTATITINKVDPRLDVVSPYKFDIIQKAPVPKYCYYFEELSANDLSCYGGNVTASVKTSIKKKYHDYSICDDGIEDYYMDTYDVGWTYEPTSIGMNTGCSNKTHTITATQNESGLKLTTTITQSYDCEHHDYITNCSASPSSIGSGGGSGSIYADAWYYDRTCTVNYDNTSYSPTSYSFGANTDQSSKTHAITVCNAGGACCTVYVTQDGAPAPAGCSPNSGYSMSASINTTSVSCDGGSVTVTVDTCKKDGEGGGDVSWSVTPGGGSGTGAGSATVSIGATDTNRSTTITVTSEAGTCEFSVSQSGCEEGGGGDTGSTGETGGNCCKPYIHTDWGVHGLDGLERDVIFKVYDSCYKGSPNGWTASLKDRSTGAWPTWATLSPSSGSGYCCSGWDNCTPGSIPNFDEVKAACVASTTQQFTLHVTKNTTGQDRIADLIVSSVGQCDDYSEEYILQHPADEEPTGSTGCSECYVAFENSRTVQMESSGGSLNNEGIVKHGNGTNCDVDVKNFTITSTDGNTSGITVSPSGGNISSCNITIPQNNSTSSRTITITIHPNIDEKSTANCKN